MQKEKLAIIGLAVIIIGALSAYLVIEYKDEIIENLFGDGGKTTENGNGTIAIGDCADVNYVGKLANGTVFDTSYEDVAKEWGLHVEGREYSPLKIFITLNASMFAPEGYNDYYPGIEGFMEGLVGLKEGEKATIGSIPPEKAYGKLPKVGDVIDISDPSLGSQGMHLEFIEIKENASVPADFVDWVEGNTTTLYVLKDTSHYVGETMTIYLSWENASVVTKMNDTKVWLVTTPPEDKMNNFTWQELELSASGGTQSYWENASSAVINESNNTITVTHTPEVGQKISISSGYYSTEYTVVNVTDDKINCSYIDFDENTSYFEFDRIVTIEINQTQNITYSWPPEIVDYILSIIKQVDPTIPYSLGYLAGETLTFQVEIVKVYKTSQES